MPVRRPRPRAVPVGWCVALAGIGLAAQSSRSTEGVVVPSPTDGGQRFAYRLFHSIGTPAYQQVLFRVPDAVPNPVRSIAFRRMSHSSSPPTYPAFTVDIEIWMGHSPRTPASFDHDLPGNREADLSRVLRRKVSFPARPQRTDERYPFDYRFVLDTPFVFQRNRVGVVELRILDSTLRLTDWTLGGVTFEIWADHRTKGEEFGVPCSSRYGVWQGNLLAVLDGVSPGNPSWAVIIPPPSARSVDVRFFGGLRNDQWSGLPLPYHLDKLGARDCWLYISMDWEWPQYWQIYPIGHAELSLPPDPNLVGLTVFVQGVRLNTQTNALGIETTQAWRIPVTPHKDPPLSMLSSPFGPLGLDGGQARFAIGPVFELSGQ